MAERRRRNIYPNGRFGPGTLLKDVSGLLPDLEECPDESVDTEAARQHSESSFAAERVPMSVERRAARFSPKVK